MPAECLHCSRLFLNREALQQHIASSSVEHPSCAACDRRFISQAACDAHMAAKHAPTFTCSACKRNYSSLLALEEHYRGSAAHPNCSKCGRGFKDITDRDEHHRTAHPRVPCNTCGGMMVYHDSLDDHYLQSSSHPTCKNCERGFKDKVSLLEHERLAHPKLQCIPCEREFETEDSLQNHYFASLNHPECVICRRGLKDDQEYRSHMDTHSSLLHIQPDFDDYGSDHVFSPLSFPVRRIQELTSSSVSGGEEAAISPIMTLPAKYASPIMEVQTPFFQSSSLPPPGKGAEQAWAAQENVQAPGVRLSSSSWVKKAYYPPPPVGAISTNHSKDDSCSTYTSSDSSAPRSSAGSRFSPPTSTSSLNTRHLRGGSWDTISTPVDAPSPIERQLSWRARRSTVGSSSSPFSQLSPASRFPIGSGNINNINSKLPVGTIATRNGPGRLDDNWRRELADRLKETAKVEEPPVGGSDSPLSLQNEPDSFTSAGGPLTTSPLEGVPSEVWDDKIRMRAEEVQHPEYNMSPSQAEPPLRPAPPVLNIDAPTDDSASGSSSSRSGSRSPEVFSPFGLAPLPSLSPLASTPMAGPSSQLEVEVEIEGSQEGGEGPLVHDRKPEHERVAEEEEEEPAGVSPARTSEFGTPETSVGLALDTQLPETETAAASESSTSVVEARTTSEGQVGGTQGGGGQEEEDDDDDIMSVALPLDSPLSATDGALGGSPVVPAGPFDGVGVLAADGEKVKEGGAVPSEDVSPAQEHRQGGDKNEDKKGEEEEEEEESIGSDVVVVTAPGTPIITSQAGPRSIALTQRLHCRICRSQPCVDLTATMCGHIFCYGCITQEVMKTSHCPMCKTPTLLYCLFRLDLSV